MQCGKINNYGGRVYFADKYNDLYFKIAVNLNSFSYEDNINEFSGFAYGADIRAKQYFNKFWLDGIFGINRADFKVDSVYVNGGIVNKPKGTSEYVRLTTGYDFAHVSDIVFTPFVGMLFQNSHISAYLNGMKISILMKMET